MSSATLSLLSELAGRCSPDALLDHYPVTLTPSLRRRVTELHAYLVAGHPMTDVKMARALFGKSRSGGHGPYRQLKADFAWAALGATLVPKGRYRKDPSRQDRLLRCERWLALQDLVLRDDPALEESAWRRLARMAEGCQHTEVSLKCAQRLLSIYGYQQPDEKALAGQRRRLGELTRQLHAENACRAAALRLRNAPKQIEMNVVGLKKYVAEYAVYEVQYYGHEALAQYFLAVKVYDQAYGMANDALDFFAGRYPEERLPRQHFSYLAILADLAARNVDRGLQTLARLYAYMGESRLRGQQLKLLETGLLLVLRGNRPGAAALILDRLEELGGPAIIPDHDTERWAVCLEGARVLASARNPDKALTDRLASCLRRLRWGNKARRAQPADQYTLDIFAVLDTLGAEKYRRAARLVGRLAGALAGTRVTPSHPDYRRYLFVRWLLAAARANFHRIAAPRKTAAPARALAATHPEITVEHLENEPVRFEDLIAIATARFTNRVPGKPYKIN